MNVLLTRPLTQVSALQSKVAEGGNTPIIFPTLSISPVDANASAKRYDVVIFISANAVDFGLNVLANIHYLKLFAVGVATANRLSQNRIKVDGFPKTNSSSEALLALESVAKLRGKHVLIFRGKGGRETLKLGLTKAGNTVEYIEVYARTQAKITECHTRSLVQFLAQEQGIIVITSIENLSAMLAIIAQINPDALGSIKNYPLLVLSQRIKTYAKTLDFRSIIVAKEANEAGILQALSGVEVRRFW